MDKKEIIYKGYKAKIIEEWANLQGEIIQHLEILDEIGKFKIGRSRTIKKKRG